jgi:hypothetical protein
MAGPGTSSAGTAATSWTVRNEVGECGEQEESPRKVVPGYRVKGAACLRREASAGTPAVV